MVDLIKSMSSSSTTPDLGKPTETSSEGDEKAKIVSRSPEFFAQAFANMIKLQMSGSDYSLNFNNGNGRGEDTSIEAPGNNVNSRNAVQFGDLLGDSSGKLMKCSLGDIIFLVMLILTQSTADQRNSRFEDTISQKNTARIAAQAVYQMRIAEAEAQYKVEKKQAELQRTMAIVSMVTSSIGAITACLGPLGQAIGSIAKAADAVTKTIQIVVRVLQIISTIASVVSSGINSGFQLYHGIKNLEISKNRYTASMIRANTNFNKAFLDFHMGQLNKMQEAYSMMQQNVDTMLDRINETLQEQRTTLHEVARNI
jgi:hypothetical protein